MFNENESLDDKDRAILANAIACREERRGPRMGDYVLFPTGEVERISHIFDNHVQTSPSGSFAMCSEGFMEFSGGLNPGVSKASLTLVLADIPGLAWIFHHGVVGPHRRVDVQIPCRAFLTTEPYKGFLGADFNSSATMAAKALIQQRLKV